MSDFNLNSMMCKSFCSIPFCATVLPVVVWASQCGCMNYQGSSAKARSKSWVWVPVVVAFHVTMSKSGLGWPCSITEEDAQIPCHIDVVFWCSQWYVSSGRPVERTNKQGSILLAFIGSTPCHRGGGEEGGR